MKSNPSKKIQIPTYGQKLRSKNAAKCTIIIIIIITTIKKADSVHNMPYIPLVLNQHRSPPPQQVPSLQLWICLPDFPHGLPYVGLRRSQLCLHQVPEDSSHPEGQIQVPIAEDRHPQHCVLLVCCGRQHFSQVLARVV